MDWMDIFRFWIAYLLGWIWSCYRWTEDFHKLHLAFKISKDSLANFPSHMQNEEESLLTLATRRLRYLIRTHLFVKVVENACLIVSWIHGRPHPLPANQIIY